jgi:ribonuclease HII
VLTDGFPVRGLAVPALAMWKGDEVAACVAAASVVAKVTRDQIMRDLHKEYPQYGFSRHKGYSTPSHMRALADHGPCPQHRMSFANVIGVMRARAGLPAAASPQTPGYDAEEPAGYDAEELAGAGAEELRGYDADELAGAGAEELRGYDAQELAGAGAELS